MITKKELQKYANKLNLNLGATEKNYLQIITLNAISRSFPESLIFKGGTSLMVCHKLDRFSEDLDFTAKQGINLKKVFSKIIKLLKDQDIELEVKNIETNNISKKFIFRYKGPLYQNTLQSTSKIEIDISLREEVILETTEKRILHIYDDIPSFYIQTMDLDEIFSEKIRAIMTRNKARDLYDLDFLIDKEVKFNLNLINQKLIYYNKKFSYNEFKKTLLDKEKIWDLELKNLVKNVPDFNKTVNKVCDFINKSMK